MNTGPIVKSPRSTVFRSLPVAGVLLLVQAALRAYLLASFLLRLSNTPRLARIVVGSFPLLLTSIVLPLVVLVAGASVGILALNRARTAPTAIRVFCITGLLFLTVSGLGTIASAIHLSLHVPPLTWMLLGFNAAIYIASTSLAARAS